MIKLPGFMTFTVSGLFGLPQSPVNTVRGGYGVNRGHRSKQNNPGRRGKFKGWRDRK